MSNRPPYSLHETIQGPWAAAGATLGFLVIIATIVTLIVLVVGAVSR